MYFIQIPNNSEHLLKVLSGNEKNEPHWTKSFEKINSLPVKNRVDQCITVPAYNCKSNLSPVYICQINIF